MIFTKKYLTRVLYGNKVDVLSLIGESNEQCRKREQCKEKSNAECSKINAMQKEKSSSERAMQNRESNAEIIIEMPKIEH